MNTQQLKAVYQLAEMHHKADPKNEGKKHDCEVSKKAYENALAAEQEIETETGSEELDKAIETNHKNAPADAGKGSSSSADAVNDLSIEELEAILKDKKAAKKEKDAAEKQAAKEATEAAKLAAKAGSEAAQTGDGSTGSEDSKKNESPS